MTRFEKKIGIDNLKIFWIDDLEDMLKINFILVKFDNKLFNQCLKDQINHYLYFENLIKLKLI